MFRGFPFTVTTGTLGYEPTDDICMECGQKKLKIKAECSHAHTKSGLREYLVECQWCGEEYLWDGWKRVGGVTSRDNWTRLD